MAFLLRFEAYDQAATTYTVYDSDNPPALTSTTLLSGLDWGNAVWDQQQSGVRGTLGQVTATQQVANRTVTIPLRVYGTSKDVMLQNIRSLELIVDLMRRFGGRIAYKSQAQTYTQYAEVLGTQGFQVTSWGKRAENRYAADTVAVFTCAPYVSGDPMDIYDTFTTNLASYGADAGALGNVAVSANGLTAVANLTTENRLIHTALGYTYYDVAASVSGTVGSTITSYRLGCVTERASATQCLIGYVDDNGTNSRLRIDKVVAGVTTNLGTANLAARLTAGQSVTVRVRVERNRVAVDYYAAPDVTATATQTVTVTLSTSDAALFGVNAAGTCGVSWTPQHASATITQFAVEPFTYVGRVLPDVFRLQGIPGDKVATATADVSIGNISPSGTAIDFALVGWSQSPAPFNMLEMGTVFDADPTGNWVTTAASSVTNACTSITRVTTTSKYGQYSIEATATSGNANSGPSIRIYGKFVAGVTYTASVWVQAPSSVANVTVKLGNNVGDMATSATTALSTSWQQVSVTWTPTTDYAEAYLGVVRVTSGAADVFRIDGETVYQGTTAPSLPSQTAGRGGPPPFGVLEAENSANQTANADATATSGATATTSAFLTVDPNLLVPAGRPFQSVPVEVWGRVYPGANNASATLTCGWYPLETPQPAAVYSVDFGPDGQTISTPSQSWQLQRFGVIDLPVTGGRSRAVVFAKASGNTDGSTTSTGAKTPTANQSMPGYASWTTPGNAAALDGSTTSPSTSPNAGGWYWKTFGFGIPAGSQISRITATLTFVGSTGMQFWVSLPSLGVASGALTIPTSNTVTLSGSRGWWQATEANWTDTALSDANFLFGIIASRIYAGIALDRLQVTVEYLPPPDTLKIDHVILVPSRQRVSTATGLTSFPTDAWLPAPTGGGLVKRIRSDGSALIGNNVMSQDTGGMFPSPGVGGSTIEFPSGSTDVVVKLSDMIPGTVPIPFQADTTAITADVKFHVTPRWAFMRDQ